MTFPCCPIEAPCRDHGGPSAAEPEQDLIIARAEHGPQWPAQLSLTRIDPEPDWAGPGFTIPCADPELEPGG
jgi:hypothetical protein